MGGEIDFIDDQQIRPRNARAAFGGNFVSARDVDDVDRQIGEFRREGGGEIVAAGFISTRSSAGNFARMSATAARFIEASSRIAVCGQPPVSTPTMRSAASEPERTRNSASHLV